MKRVDAHLLLYACAAWVGAWSGERGDATNGRGFIVVFIGMTAGIAFVARVARVGFFGLVSGLGVADGSGRAVWSWIGRRLQGTADVPASGDTDRVTGHGVYANEQVQLVCYAYGESVGR